MSFLFLFCEHVNGIEKKKILNTMGVDVLNSINIKCVQSKSSSWSAITTPTAASVKRSLFGVVDHAEAMSFFQQEFEKIEAEKKLAYNFDFRNEKPLSGPFKWESVTTNSSCRRSPSKVTKFKRRSLLKMKVPRDNNVDVKTKLSQSMITGEFALNCSLMFINRESATFFFFFSRSLLFEFQMLVTTVDYCTR